MCLLTKEIYNFFFFFVCLLTIEIYNFFFSFFFFVCVC